MLACRSHARSPGGGRRWTFALCALSMVCALACTGLKRREDPAESDGGSQRDDAGSKGGSRSDGGRSAAGDGSQGGASGSADMSGRGGSGVGGSAGQTGDPRAGSGGSMENMAGSDAAGSGAIDAGTDAEVGPLAAVRGTVIDYYRNPVPNASIAIGSTTVLTDEDGEFTIDDVPETYDVSVSLTITRFVDAQELAGYLFVGLTRRDPTLQVYHGLTKRSGSFDRTIENVSFPLPEYDEIQIDWASQYGEAFNDGDEALLHDEALWDGPASVQGTAHALYFSNSMAAPHVPIAYHAHDAHPLAIDEDALSSVGFDLASAGDLPTGLVTGSVSTANAGGRENDVFVRFSDGAALQVLSDVMSDERFSYLVPSLANSALVVGAMVSTPNYPPYAVAYSDDVSPGTDLEIEIPTIPTQLQPAPNKTGVDENTEFTWLGRDQVVMFVVKADGFLETYYVITAQKSARIPLPQVTVPALVAGSDYFWQVRVHNDFATVDDATGPEGYLDAYCYGRLSGPRRGAGSHLESGMRYFTTAE